MALAQPGGARQWREILLGKSGALYILDLPQSQENPNLQIRKLILIEALICPESHSRFPVSPQRETRRKLGCNNPAFCNFVESREVGRW